ncbi:MULTISPECIES: response regulator [unclassified Pseudomonas]|uniref:response regulator n=1 Tax=unclassified Pseudomonas TaxID=196821 RepID=UPI00235EB175|nr:MULTISPECIES: response regulator [unclassified Pseudomonas]MDR6178451.1 DNA-binding NtrC family response regulator [Pseudomonas sp. SORGH_AS_0211]
MDTNARPPHTSNLLAVVSEDELLLQALVREVLKQEGFHVETFGTADAALQFLELHWQQVNVVVSNVRMPGVIDGIQLAKIVNERWPGVPFVLMSGYAGLRSDIPAGVPFLHKPWTLDQLTEAVWQVVPLPSP